VINPQNVKLDSIVVLQKNSFPLYCDESETAEIFLRVTCIEKDKSGYIFKGFNFRDKEDKRLYTFSTKYVKRITRNEEKEKVQFS
jgi:hypothetical protein